MQKYPVRMSSANRYYLSVSPESLEVIPTQWYRWLSGVYRVSLGNAVQLVRFLTSYVRDGSTMSVRLSRC